MFSAPVKRPSGRNRPKPYDPLQARTDAQRWLASGLSVSAERLLDWLARAGVLTVGQLSLFSLPLRTIKRYAQRHIVSRLPFSAAEVMSAMRECGLPVDAANPAHHLLYALGPVGAEIARLRHDVPPVTGYAAYTLHRTLHDVACNEVVLRLAQRAETLGWRPNWLGKYEAALRFKRDGEMVEVEPDAMLELRRGESRRAVIIEFHAEDWRSRAKSKVRRYEALFRSEHWREVWDYDRPPVVLAVFTHTVVGDGYKQAVAALGGGGRTAYYGKTLAAVCKGAVDEWVRIGGTKESIWVDT